jgi:hypothetical protein
MDWCALKIESYGEMSPGGSTINDGVCSTCLAVYQAAELTVALVAGGYQAVEALGARLTSLGGEALAAESVALDTNAVHFSQESAAFTKNSVGRKLHLR